MDYNIDKLDFDFDIRQLELADYDKQYFQLLNQLTPTQIPSYKYFVDWFNILHNNNENHKIFVIEDKEKQKVIASITLFIEYKFIHGCSYVGHIEDFVVDSEYRNKKLGKKLLVHCINMCTEKQCYKIILNCKNDLISYYEKYGFENKNAEMSLYL
jgi:glucosamine-phosphate N-acetyltransferase